MAGTGRAVAAQRQDPPPPVLEAVGLRKSYGGVEALRGVDLRLYRGEVLGLVGANGAGKSTLVGILTGDRRADGGALLVGGAPMTLASVGDAHRQGVGFVSQELDLVPDLSVASNILLNAESRFTRFGLIQGAALEAEAARQLERVRLDLAPSAMLASLSLGDRQLVAVARALRDAARVLILDEPTSSLTPWEADRLLVLLRSLAGSGTAVLFISHRLDEVVGVSDRVMVLRDGRIVAEFAKADADPGRIADAMVPDRRVRAPGMAGSRVRGEVVLRASSLTVGRHGPADFEVARGEVVGFFGLVGAGRSSIGRALVGAERLKGGSIVIHGRERTFRSTWDAYRAGVGYLSEDRKAESVFAGLSVSNNIGVRAPRTFRQRGGWLDRRTFERIVRALMDRLAIKAPSGKVGIETLSGGNQQKTALARLLTEDMAVLVLDEPTHGIDVAAKADLIEELDRLAKDGMAIVVIASELDQLTAVADRILVFRNGCVVAEVGSDADDATLLRLASGAAA